MKFTLPIEAVAEAIKLPQFEYISTHNSKFIFSDWEIKQKENIEVSLTEVPIEFVIEVARIIELGPKPFSNKFSINASNRLANKLRRFIKLKDNSNSGNFAITKLENTAEVAKSWMNDKQDAHIVKIDNEDVKLPLFKLSTEHGDQIYMLTSVTYVKPSRDEYDIRPRVKFTFSSIMLNNVTTTTKTIFSTDFRKGITIDEIIETFDTEYINAEEYVEYIKYSKLAKQYMDVIGSSYDCIDTMQLTNGKLVNPKHSKEKSLVVMDYEGYTKKYAVSSYSRNEFEQAPFHEILSKKIRLPEQSVVCGYYLSGHQWFLGSVHNFVPYEFKGIEFMDKLVIPDEHKDMVRMLIEFSNVEIDDLISGKSGGSFILSKGAPGLGKTLTAEVVSEAMSLPLYEIQCSQLGIRVEDIEKKFDEILINAKRWKTILVINEADVYIRERGTDINHNAIVGVFLRLLEKSNGVMFMTTNLDNVDNAIESRATIILNYEQPSTEEFVKIFEILSENYDIKLNDTFIENLTSYINSNNLQLSGRDAKSMCKLLKMHLAYTKNENVCIDDFRKLLKYKS